MLGTKCPPFYNGIFLSELKLTVNKLWPEYSAIVLNDGTVRIFFAWHGWCAFAYNQGCLNVFCTYQMNQPTGLFKVMYIVFCMA